MLLLVAGAWQVVSRPIAAAVNSSPAPAATTTVSDDQARTTAVVAVTDWLTYNPQNLSAYRNIAGARFGNGAAASAWSGPRGWRPTPSPPAPSSPNPTGTSSPRSRPGSGSPPPPSPRKPPPRHSPPAVTLATTPPCPPAGPSSAPSGCTCSSRSPRRGVPTLPDPSWPPPTSPAPPPPPATGSTDSTATTSSQPWAVSLFTALAGTDATALGYLTTNPLITPLNGQVQFNGLSTWQVTDQAEGDTGSSRTGTGTVAWKFRSPRCVVNRD